MKMKAYFFISVLYLLVFSAVGQQSVMFVNLDTIIAQLPETKTKIKILESYGKQLQGQLEKKTTYIQQKQKELEENQATLSPKLLEEKRMELQKLSQDIASSQQQSQANFAKKQEELFQPLYDKVIEAINQVAKKNKYDFVFSQNKVAQTPFIYWKEKNNITNHIVEKMLQ